MRERITPGYQTRDTRREFWYNPVGDRMAYDLQVLWKGTDYSSRMLDVVTPDFRTRMKRGEVVNNPMSYKSFRKEFQHAWYSGTGSADPNDPTEHSNKWEPFGVSDGTVPGEDVDWLSMATTLDNYQSYRDRATSAAWSRVDLSEAELLASLGELPETLKWITSIFARFTSLCKLLSKKKLAGTIATASRRAFLRKNVRQNVDSVSDLWLEFRYAFRPLVMELDSSIKALKTVIDKAIRHVGRGYDEFETQVTEEIPHSSSTFSFVDTRSYSTKANFRAGVLYSVSADIDALSSIWGLDNGIETVWELTPFSFIVDWFFNVGNVIGSWSIPTGLKPLASWVTETYYFEKKYVYGITATTSPYFNVSCELELGKASVLWTWKRRIVDPSRSYLPSLSINLDTLKILDLTLIAKGLLYGKLAK